MARIVYVANLLEPEPQELGEHTGPLIDWLQREYPGGFPVQQYIYINRAFLAVDDYDLELGDDDEVLIVLKPAAPVAAFLGPTIVAALATAAASAAISFAISFVVSKLFPTNIDSDSSASAAQPSAGSVYSLAVPTNSIKLGDPIPVIYGEVLATPDIASQPYSFYYGNDQYVDILFCLGQGEHVISDITISDTSVTQIASGVVEWHNFGPGQPADHNQTMGTIENWWLANSTGVPHRFHEDVDTSVEVSDQEIKGRSVIDYPGTVSTGGVLTTNSAIDPALDVADLAFTSSFFYGSYTVASIAADRKTLTTAPAFVRSRTVTDANVGYNWQPITNEIQIGQIDAALRDLIFTSVFLEAPNYLVTMEVGGTTYTLVPIGISGLSPPAGPTSLNLICDISPALTSGAGTASLTGVFTEPSTFTVQGQFDTPVGPFAASRLLAYPRRLEFDFSFPQGLYKVDQKTGEFQNRTVSLRVLVEEIDDQGNVIGAGPPAIFTYTAKTNTPQRYTEFLDMPAGQARYQATVIRTTPDSTSNLVTDKAYWVGLRGILINKTGPVYGDVTLVAMRFKATNGLASDALRRIGMRCTRILPSGKPSDDPAAIVEDIYTNAEYGAKRPTSEIDVAAFVGISGKFNGIFDQKTTVWEAIRSALLPGYAAPVTNAAQLSCVIDKTQTVDKFVFNQTNMVQDSISFTWVFDQIDDIDGYEIEWRDIQTWVAQYTVFPATAANPEKVTLMGCTDPTTALAYARYLWYRKLYRRKQVSFTTELEGFLPQLGDRISVRNDRMGAAERYIVSKITPQEGLTVDIEGYSYDSRVYATS